MTTDETTSPSHRRIAVATGFVAFAFYLLSFGGIFHNSADEWFMFAVTESLAKHGALSINQIYWVGEWMGWARFGVDGHLYVPYTNFSTAQSLVGVPAYLLAQLIPGAGLAQGALLTNLFVVAVVLALLVLTLSELGFSPGVSLATVALFGIGSALWPYSQTYFGEPLLGLAFLACFYCLVRFHRQYSQSSATTEGNAAWPWAWLTGAAWGLAIVVKPAGVLIGPFLLIYTQAFMRQEPLMRRLRVAAPFLLPVAVVGLAIFALNAARFGFGEGLQHADAFSTPLAVGLWGLLFSPGRSVFLYSPVVLLALPGLYLLYRRQQLLAVTLCLFLASYVLFFALWSDWHGGRTNWGPRTLVPLLPLLAIGTAALLSTATHRRLVWASAALVGLMGAIVQALAVANDYLPVMLDLMERYPAAIAGDAAAATRSFASLQDAPILLQWQRFSPAHSDVAWLYGKDGLNTIALALSLSLLAISGAYLLATWAKRPSRWLPWAPPALALAALFTIALLLPRYANHPRYTSPEYQEALGQFEQRAASGAALVTLDQTAHFAFNFQRRALHRYGLSVYTNDDLPDHTADLLHEIAQEHTEVWLLATGAEITAVEEVLHDLLPRTEEHRWNDTRLVRARRADQAPPADTQRVEAVFGEKIELVAATVDGEVAPRERLNVDLYWEAVRPVDRSYSVSTQLIDSAGNLVGQQDGVPGQGDVPTTKWLVGKTVLDPRVIEVPPYLEPGEYQLLAIVYDVESGERLDLRDDTDRAVIATFTVL